MENKTNWLAIVVCAVAGMGLGFLWYGTLFSDTWMNANGITMVDGKAVKGGVELDMTMPMIVNLISLLVYGILINWLINKSSAFNMKSGATIGAVIGTIAIFGIYTGNRYAGDPISLSMVDGFYTFLLFTMIGAIIGAWRPK